MTRRRCPRHNPATGQRHAGSRDSRRAAAPAPGRQDRSPCSSRHELLASRRPGARSMISAVCGARSPMPAFAGSSCSRSGGRSRCGSGLRWRVVCSGLRHVAAADDLRRRCRRAHRSRRRRPYPSSRCRRRNGWRSGSRSARPWQCRSTSRPGRSGRQPGRPCASIGTAMAASMAEAAMIEVFMGGSPSGWVKSCIGATAAAPPIGASA